MRLRDHPQPRESGVWGECFLEQGLWYILHPIQMFLDLRALAHGQTPPAIRCSARGGDLSTDTLNRQMTSLCLLHLCRADTDIASSPLWAVGYKLTTCQFTSNWHPIRSARWMVQSGLPKKLTGGTWSVHPCERGPTSIYSNLCRGPHCKGFLRPHAHKFIFSPLD